jgi:hypothetical protein
MIAWVQLQHSQFGYARPPQPSGVLMRKRPRPLLATLSLIIGTVAALVAAVGAWRTYTVEGEAAVQRMDVAEREYLKRLGRLDGGMSSSEVESVLGPATDWTGLGADQEGTWLEVPGAPLSRVTVYIDNGSASRLRWMKMGHFTYSVELPPRDREE